jgi:hypothetical protein
MRFASRLSMLAIAGSLLFGLSSCTEDTVTDPPAQQSSYFPAAQGNYQVVKYTQMDDNNQPALSFYDSTRYVSKTTIDGKEAYIAVTFNPETGIAYDTTYYSNEGNAAWHFFSPVSFQGLSPFNFSERWIKIGDFNSSATTWTTLDTNLVDIPFQYQTMSFTGSGNVKQTYTKKELMNVALDNGSTVQAQRFEQVTSFAFVVKTGIFDVPVNFDHKEQLYFAKDMGLVKHNRDTYKINLGGLGEVPVVGFEYLMKAHLSN